MILEAEAMTVEIDAPPSTLEEIPAWGIGAGIVVGLALVVWVLKNLNINLVTKKGDDE